MKLTALLVQQGQQLRQGPGVLAAAEGVDQRITPPGFKGACQTKASKVGAVEGASQVQAGVALNVRNAGQFAAAKQQGPAQILQEPATTVVVGDNAKPSRPNQRGNLAEHLVAVGKRVQKALGNDQVEGIVALELLDPGTVQGLDLTAHAKAFEQVSESRQHLMVGFNQRQTSAEQGR